MKTHVGGHGIATFVSLLTRGLLQRVAGLVGPRCAYDGAIPEHAESEHPARKNGCFFYIISVHPFCNVVASSRALARRVRIVQSYPVLPPHQAIQKLWVQAIRVSARPYTNHSNSKVIS